MIKVTNLNKSFGKNTVFKDLSFIVNDNKVFGLIGINGSGKSTLLRVLSGVYNSDGGNIFVDETLNQGQAEVKKHIFFVPDEFPFSFISTVKDAAFLIKSFYENFNYEDFKKLLNDFSLDLKMRMGSLSKGMKKRLYLALAISANTKYIILDETFDGLDPLVRIEVKKLILTLAEERTFIIASHSLRDLEDIVDEFLILNNGQNYNESISDTIGKYLKYQLAYKENISKELFDNLLPVSLEITAKFVTIVLDTSLDINFYEELLKTNPVVIEELEVSFEEYFVSSAKKGRE